MVDYAKIKYWQQAQVAARALRVGLGALTLRPSRLDLVKDIHRNRTQSLKLVRAALHSPRSGLPAAFYIFALVSSPGRFFMPGYGMPWQGLKLALGVSRGRSGVLSSRGGALRAGGGVNPQIRESWQADSGGSKFIKLEPPAGRRMGVMSPPFSKGLIRAEFQMKGEHGKWLIIYLIVYLSPSG